MRRVSCGQGGTPNKGGRPLGASDVEARGCVLGRLRKRLSIPCECQSEGVLSRLHKNPREPLAPPGDRVGGPRPRGSLRRGQTGCPESGAVNRKCLSGTRGRLPVAAGVQAHRPGCTGLVGCAMRTIALRCARLHQTSAKRVS